MLWRVSSLWAGAKLPERHQLSLATRIFNVFETHFINYKNYYNEARVGGDRVGNLQADVIFDDQKVRNTKLFAGRTGQEGITYGHYTSSGSTTKARLLIDDHARNAIDDEHSQWVGDCAWALDGNEGWYGSVIRTDPGKPEQFFDIFKPEEVRQPASVLAKNFADRIRIKYPKIWAAMTVGTLVPKIMAADGAPVMPKMVVELRKMPQFSQIQYRHDVCHSFNLLTKDATKASTVLQGRTESIMTTVSSLSNQSICVQKMYSAFKKD